MAGLFGAPKPNDPASARTQIRTDMATAARPIAFEEAEARFRGVMRRPLAEASEIGDADIVVGIPFHNEAEVVASVFRTVEDGLSLYYGDRRCVIVAAGAPAAAETLDVINSLPHTAPVHRLAFLLEDDQISGKGWSVRAIMEIARSLGADLAIVEADLKSREKNGAVAGLAPDWVSLLIDPILTKGMDLVISRFNRHYFECPIARHLVHPLLTAIYNRPVHDPVGAQWGISHRLFRIYLQDSRHPWHAELGGYGIDTWLVTTAISSGARICEVNLGVKMHRSSPGKMELVLQHTARVLFEQIVADRQWWEGQETVGKPSLLQHLPVFGVTKPQEPDWLDVAPEPLMTRYRQGFRRFHSLYRGVLSQGDVRILEGLSRAGPDRFRVSARLWAQVLHSYLLGFAFGKEFARGDLLLSLAPLHEARMAGYALELNDLEARLERALPREARRLVSLEADRLAEEVIDELLRLKPGFVASWQMSREAARSPVPKVTYREFVPGVPLVVPLEITTTGGRSVAANDVYQSVFHRYRDQFEEFIHEKLKVPRDAGSEEISRQLASFMHQLEAQVDQHLLPGDLFTVEGTQAVVAAAFAHFSRQDSFALVPDMASWILWRHPPIDLLTKLGYTDLTTLLKDHDANDILALAGWSEEREYAELVWDLIRGGVRTEHFEKCRLRPLIVSYEDFPSLVEMKDISAMNKICGRLVVSNLHKGMGGEFPKLRYLTTVGRDIIEAERFSDLWEGFAEERKDFGEKVLNSLEGHWGSVPLSGHNLYESGNQRLVAGRIGEMASRIANQAGADADRLRLAQCLKHMADSYHLAFTLPDGRFIPCSAWTWASYSFKGGTGMPTPLSLHVERDWSSREFLTEYYKAAGGREAAIQETIDELMAQGREWEDLSPILLGEVSEAHTVIVKTPMAPEQTPAGGVTRFVGNPILEPIREHTWESKYVLNPGAIKLGGRVHLVYRANGADDISRLGLAISDDGFSFTERLEYPIFEPDGRSEERGCEDPRLTIVEDRVYMLYTAYSGLVAQIAMASISCDDFLQRNWKAWHRHGLVFPGFFDKDAVLFPERFGDRYAMLHRVEPHMWITFSPHLRCPWPRREHKILAGSRPGMVWDGAKIGAGAQPLKTRLGWLLITHGVDHAHTYRLGVMLLHLTDPTIVLYRSPNCILEPRESYEIGEPGKAWVPNVVFTCGALPLGDEKKTLGPDDEVLVYYGAADAAIAVAQSRLADLVTRKVL